jgi:N-alpha-acetyltransferase 15/16, NatA auxiliary subunit
LSLLTDLSALHTQTRHFSHLVSSRLLILQQFPKQKKHFIAFSLSLFLNSQLSLSHHLLSSFSSLISPTSISSLPHEAKLDLDGIVNFHAQVLEEMGDWEKGLELLEERKDWWIDREEFMRRRARFLNMGGGEENFEKGRWGWSLLLEGNEEDVECLKGYLHSVLGYQMPDHLENEQRIQVLKVLKDLQSKFPKSKLIKRMQLELIDSSSVEQDQEFSSLIRSYLIDGLEKGIPSLFNDLKTLYTDPNKVQSIDRILNSLKLDYEQSSPSSDETSDEIQPLEIQKPSSYIWLLHFLSLHLSLSSPKDLTTLQPLDLAISHTPTLPDLYLTRSLILKRRGDLKGAIQDLKTCVDLDGQDRFLNSKLGKYLLRDQKRNEALEVLKCFTKV